MYLFGASGHCKVVIDVIQKSSLDVIEMIVDDNPRWDKIEGIPVVKTPYDSFFFKDKCLIISIGNNKIRKEIANRIPSNYLVAKHPK